MLHLCDPNIYNQIIMAQIYDTCVYNILTSFRGFENIEATSWKLQPRNQGLLNSN